MIQPGDKDGVHGTPRTLLWMAVPFQVGFLVLGRGFISLWLGPSYVGPSFPVLIILSLAFTLAVSQGIAVKVIYGMGNLRFFTLVVVLEALANLALSVILVRPFGIVGVAAGTALPNLISNAIVVACVCRALSITGRKYVVETWLKPVILGCVLGLLWLGIIQLIPLRTWPRFLLVGSLGTALYGCLALWGEFGRTRIEGWIKSTGLGSA